MGDAGGAVAGSALGGLIMGPAGQVIGGAVGAKGGFGELTDPDVSKSFTRHSVELGAESEFEKRTREAGAQDYEELRNIYGQGPGASEVAQGQSATKDLASMLEQYKSGGFLPGQDDWNTANMFADKAFQPQQVAMQQAFQQQNIRANQLAAQLGRPANDPIIQAKLAQEQMQGAERFGAAKSAYASEYAQSLPQQRLAMQGQLADVRNSLASQAMSNRQALLGLGNQLQSQERNWRLQTGNQVTQSRGESGGGIRAAIGTIGGIVGTGASIAGMFAGVPPVGMLGGQQGPSTGGSMGQFGNPGGGGNRQRMYGG